MRIFIDYDLKVFDDKKASIALERCENICSDCEKILEECLLDSSDCPVKNAIEALRGMIRAGKGVRRYNEIGSI